MLEIRIHGRGGQGAVLASRILAWAFFKRGKFVQSFPFFGVERRGAPVYACTRVSDSPIKVRCMIKKPGAILVLDPHLSHEPTVFSGIPDGGFAVVNSDTDCLPAGDEIRGVRIFSVNGSGIAIEHGLGTPTSPIVNTVMVGAFGKASELLSIDDLAFGIEKVLGKGHEKDIEAMKKAYRLVRIMETSR